MTTPTKADPVAEFIDHVLSGICSDRVIIWREGPQIFVETSSREFGRVLGQKGKMWGAIKTCAFHAGRLARVDPPILTLNTPDERATERDDAPKFGIDWDRESFLEYVAPIIHSIVPGTPGVGYATDDGESAKLRSVWPAEARERLENVPAALNIILASAGCHVGARITLEVLWK